MDWMVIEIFEMKEANLRDAISTDRQTGRGQHEEGGEETPWMDSRRMKNGAGQSRCDDH